MLNEAMEAIKALLLEEYSLGQWILIFFVCSFAGWCWEVSLYLVKERRFVNRGFLFGPVLPIYGFGALFILLTCVPFKENTIAVALVGTVAASLLEYVTGYAMEKLFHMRYWDYSKRRFNLNGYICLLSAATWAVFSVVLVQIVHPMAHPYICRIPPIPAMILSVLLIGLLITDTVFSVRRALDLRKLLEIMEQHAKEMEKLHGGLDRISDRLTEMIKTGYAEAVEERQKRMERLAAAKERVSQMMEQKRISNEEAVRERILSLEKFLTEAWQQNTDDVKADIEETKEEYESQNEDMNEAYQRRLKKAQRVLRANPSALSRRHIGMVEKLRQIRREEKKD